MPRDGWGTIRTYIVPVAVIAKKMRNEETPTAHLGLWCARRAFAFAAVSTACADDVYRKGRFSPNEAFQLRCASRGISRRAISYRTQMSAGREPPPLAFSLEVS